MDISSLSCRIGLAHSDIHKQTFSLVFQFMLNLPQIIYLGDSLTLMRTVIYFDSVSIIFQKTLAEK